MIRDILRELFYYKNGALYYRVKNKYSNQPISKPAGCLHKTERYWFISINKKTYRRGRLVWIYFNGDIPNGMQIDHKNRIKNDDRIKNLRVVTPSDNIKNQPLLKCNKLRLKYITKHKDKKCKKGFIYRFSVRDGDTRFYKESIDLKKLIIFRNNYIKNHRPDLYLH